MTPQERLKQIQDHLSNDGQIRTVTAWRVTYYSKKHLSMFKATDSGLFVKRGRTNWDCLNFTTIHFSKVQE